MNQYKLIAIAKLLDSGYNLFIPLSNIHLSYDYLLEHNQILSRIKIIPTYISANRVYARLSFGKPPRTRQDVANIVIVREATRQVWLIPQEDVRDLTAICLEKRYDEYLLGGEALSIHKDSVFTETSRFLVEETNNGSDNPNSIVV